MADYLKTTLRLLFAIVWCCMDWSLADSGHSVLAGMCLFVTAVMMFEVVS